MNQAIWKFPVEITDEFEIPMPKGAKVLTVQMNQGLPFIWALVNLDAGETEPRCFKLVVTGHNVSNAGAYVGTFQIMEGMLVFHLFESN